MLKKKRSVVKNRCGRDNKKSLLADLYLFLGINACKEEIWEDAIENLNLYLALCPQDAYIWDKCGICYGSVYQYDDAINCFTRAINIDNTYAAAYNNRGVAFLEKSMLFQALRDIDKAIELEPSIAIFYFNRGLVHKWQGNIKAALKDYHTTIRMQPNLPEIHNYRGELFLDLGEYEKAGADFDRELFINPSDSNAWANSALVSELISQS